MRAKKEDVNVTDEMIIQLYWQRDENAISQTDAKYGKYCFKISRNILSDNRDAQECVNDTWLRTWNAIPPTRPTKLKLFLAKITRNLSLDRLRQQSSEKRGGILQALHELDECTAGTCGVETHLEFTQLTDCINIFLGTLTEKERGIFLRRYFFGENIQEISMRYCVRQGSIYTILSRTRAKLRAYLEKEGYIL